MQQEFLAGLALDRVADALDAACEALKDSLLRKKGGSQYVQLTKWFSSSKNVTSMLSWKLLPIDMNTD